jgi:hypothetical protein
VTPGPSPYAVAVAAKLRLSVAQSATLKAIGGELLTRAELSAFRTLTRTFLAKPNASGYREAWVRAGRRSGKSLHLGGPFAVAALLGYYEDVLSVGEKGRVLVLAPTLPHLKQLLDGIAGVLDALGIAYDRREGEIEPRGRRTLVQGVVADHLGPRSGTAVAAIVDEAALLPFHEGADGYDVEIFAALRPSLATTNGKLLVLSSPWARAGEHFNTIEKCIGKTKGAVLAVDGPTWLWHPALTEERTRELEPNPGRWAREYAAKAGDTESSAFASRDIARAIRGGVVERPRVRGLRYGAAGDLAFRGDGCVLAIGHRELSKNDGGPPKDRLVLDVLRIKRAPPGGTLDPEEVIIEWATALKRYGVRKLWLDGHGYDLASSRFKKRGIRTELLAMNLPAQAVRFDALGGRLRAGTVDLLDSDLMKRELTDLRAELLPGGAVRYEAPRRAGASDDCADALAALAYEGTRELPAIGGNVKHDVRVTFSPGDGGVEITERWYEETSRNGVVAFMPVCPPLGSPSGDRALRERQERGILCPGDPPLPRPGDLNAFDD